MDDKMKQLVDEVLIKAKKTLKPEQMKDLEKLLGDLVEGRQLFKDAFALPVA